MDMQTGMQKTIPSSISLSVPLKAREVRLTSITLVGLMWVTAPVFSTWQTSAPTKIQFLRQGESGLLVQNFLAGLVTIQVKVQAVEQ